MSPTQRTLRWLRDAGYTAQVTEKWNPHARVRQDLFGCIDIISLGPEGILGVQACAGSSHAARRKKSLAEPRLIAWLAAGGKFSVVSWSKKGARGKRKEWECRSEPVTMADIEEAKP